MCVRQSNVRRAFCLRRLFPRKLRFTYHQSLIWVAYQAALVPSATNLLQPWPSANALALEVGVPPTRPIVWTCFTDGKAEVNGFTSTATMVGK